MEFTFKNYLLILPESGTRNPDIFSKNSHCSGPYNSSGEWGGVMGNVVNSKYQLSVNSWMYILERFKVLDYATILDSKMAMFLFPDESQNDLKFFIRCIY